MMGVGKTSMKFIDIDQIIERKLNATISDIFKKKGENFFRKYEEKITLNEVSKLNAVISLGGGAFINPKIRRQVQINCTSFWLDLDVPLLKERLINSKKRPLLKNNKLKIRISGSKYEIIIGQKILKNSHKYIKSICPNVKKIALVIDKNIPQSFV